MDGQPASGRVPPGKAKRSKKAGTPAAAIVGGLLDGYDAIYDCGIESVVTTINGTMSIEDAMANSQALYLDAARRLLRAVRCGMKLAQKEENK